MKRIFLLLAGLVMLFSLTAAPVQSAVLSIRTLQAKPQPEAETQLAAPEIDQNARRALKAAESVPSSR